MAAEDAITVLRDLDIDVAPVDRHAAEIAGLLQTATGHASLSLGIASAWHWETFGRQPY